MANYNELAKKSQDTIYKFIKSVMKDRKMSQKKLSELIEVDESTLIRNFQKKTEMSVITLFKICKVLEICPINFIIPK